MYRMFTTGNHYCKDHQGNYSHYDKQNCDLCVALNEKPSNPVARYLNATEEYKDNTIPIQYPERCD